MSDFLTHLAARVLAPAASVRPKLASLFEPLTATGALNESPLFGLQTVEDAASDQHGTPDFETANHRRPAPAEAGADATTGEANPVSPSANSVRLSQINSGSESRDRSTEQPPALLAPRSSRREEAHSSSEPSQKLQPSVASPTIHSTTQHLAASPPPTIPNQPKTASRPGTEETPFHPLLVPPPRDGRAPEPIRPAPSAHTTPRAPAPTAESLVPPPAIHVTIGRLEIRAVTPPAAQARPQSTRAPVVSLEDYLRQRASGGGR